MSGATLTTQFPQTEEVMRSQLLSAMSVDPSGKTAAALVMAYLDLARSEAALKTITEAQRFVAESFGDMA